MSEDITAILLPSARVDFFMQDDATARTAEKLSADWRFARVDVGIERGDIDRAIEKYGQTASPELIILETSDIGEGFIAKLGALAGACAEGTDAVIIGPTNDVHLYRSLVGMGVRDYLVRPVAENDLVTIIARALVEKRGISGSRLISVIGAKGGVGCTTVAQLMGWVVANKIAEKTMLLDAAGTSGTLGVAYGLEPSTSFSEAVRVAASGSEDDMKRMIQMAGDNLSLLICGGDPLMTESPDAEAVEGLLKRVMQKYPVVVMDLSGAAPNVQKRALALSTHVFVVSTPMLPALRNCRSLLSEIKNLRNGLKNVQMIVSMQGMAGSEEVPAADIKSALDLEPSVKIPYLPKIFSGSEATGKPVGENKAAADIVQNMLPLAALASGRQESVDEKSDSSGKALGFLNKLRKKS